MRLKEVAKYLVYRAPLLQKIAHPRYRYKISPAQLAFLCEGIDQTKQIGGCIMEIGVARGETSTFILEHMKTTGDTRPVYFLDTFSGFTAESVDHEIRDRKKDSSQLDSFRYGDAKIFEQNLRRQGYSGFQVIQGDASQINYSDFGPIAVVLLDIDLYQPTIKILRALWPCLMTPGFICVDDCAPNTSWDGALQAYNEFLAELGIAGKVVGGKGGLLVKEQS